jgi:pyruvate kinase
MDRVKQLRGELHLNTAIMLDTKGPEIRLRNFKNGCAQVSQGQLFTFKTGDEDGDENFVNISFDGLARNVSKGNRILVDDGRVEFEVEGINDTAVVCRVLNSGMLKNHKSINVPNVDIDIPYMSQADRADILFGIEQDVDFIAASFVRRADDVLELRRLLNENGGSHIQIISTIENTRGVKNLNEIIAVSDGIMVARGDMGVELRFSELPAIQKEIIESCYKAGKHVVTATQMLESMVTNPRPTRAEVSDIANAIYDGTTAIMLSGESAAGLYPVESLKAMAEIAEKTEQSINYKKRFMHNELELDEDIPNAVSSCACLASFTLDVSAIVAVTRSGYSAKLVSSYRPACDIIAPATSERVCRQLNLTWGVHPILAQEQPDSVSLIRLAAVKAKETGLVGRNDLVVITGSVKGLHHTDFMHIQRL